MIATDYCEVCGLEGQPSQNAGLSRRVRVTCKRCGTFEWEPIAAVKALPVTSGRRVRLSAFVREQNAAGITPLLTPEVIQQVERRRLPRLHDRALRALAVMVREIGYELSTTFLVSDMLRVHAESYSEDDRELSVLLEILEAEGLIKVAGAIPIGIRFTPSGLISAEELSQAGGAYVQGFVAMSFDPSMNDSYTLGFDPGIRAAGYRPLRIDGKEHINGISDEIITEIRRSRFIVADYTLANNGVYFEAGVAVGLGVPVIGTCRADFLDKLHFDIRHINTIRWASVDQLTRDLSKRISSVLGDGPFSHSET